MDPNEILILVFTGVACLVVGGLVGILYRKHVAEAKIGTAEQKAKELVSEAGKQAETMKKEALLSAKEEIMLQKNEMEQEIKERRAEVSRTETRLTKKEENLDKSYKEKLNYTQTSKMSNLWNNFILSIFLTCLYGHLRNSRGLIDLTSMICGIIQHLLAW